MPWGLHYWQDPEAHSLHRHTHWGQALELFCQECLQTYNFKTEGNRSEHTSLQCVFSTSAEPDVAGEGLSPWAVCSLIHRLCQLVLVGARRSLKLQSTDLWHPYWGAGADYTPPGHPWPTHTQTKAASAEFTDSLINLMSEVLNLGEYQQREKGEKRSKGQKTPQNNEIKLKLSSKIWQAAVRACYTTCRD